MLTTKEVLPGFESDSPAGLKGWGSVGGPLQKARLFSKKGSVYSCFLYDIVIHEWEII